MSNSFTTDPASTDEVWARHLLGRFFSFCLAAIAAFALALNASNVSFDSIRLGAVLVVLVSLQLLRCPRFLFCREFALYAVFMWYMSLSLLWGPDVIWGRNTLFPALDCLLIFVLFGSLVTYHDLNAVFAGMFVGFSIDAVAYTVTQGFPFVYPVGFSYNAVASKYLFGLFIVLLLGWSTRSRIWPLLIGFVLLVLIAATTSIKTNLGIMLGAAAAGLMYFKGFARVFRRNAIPFTVVAGLMVFAAASNEAVVERVQTGIERVTLGVEILLTREDIAGTTSLGAREVWMQKGLEGWYENPLFGYGVEAFRANYGITSHSTPIDLLYNFGFIGLFLFYSIFASIAWRLHRSHPSMGAARPIILGGLVCYLFITLLGAMHYNGLLAVFVAISTALLIRYSPIPVSAVDTHS